MSVFQATLRGRINRVEGAILEARQAGHDYEAELHSARLADLLDLAARNDVDTTGWVDPTVLELAVPED